MTSKGIKDKSYVCLNCGKPIEWKGHSYGHKYCDNKCQAELRNKQWYEKYRPEFEAGTLKSRSAIKRFVELRDGYVCNICGQLPEHNGKPLIMILDHIDGNATNNSPSNFRLVCPNCDTQLPTYKAKNMGNGRGARGLTWNNRV